MTVVRMLDVDYKRVLLNPAPLVLVLCQLRFNKRPQLGERAVVEAIQRHLDGQYPDIEQRDTQEARVQFGAPGIELHQQKGTHHVLRSPHHPWWVLVSPAVATLVAPTYSERSDFIGRVAALREALSDAGGVPAVERVGVRYVSRVTDPDFVNDLDRYVRQEVLGATVLPADDATELVHSLFDMVVQRGSVTGRARAGVVPPGVTPDPAIEPVDDPAWIIDVDMWDPTYRPADSTVDERAAELAEAQYQLFRWIVTEDFLRYFGGDI